METGLRRLVLAALVGSMVSAAVPAQAQQAQRREGGGIGIGVLGGITRSTFDNDGPVDFFEDRNGWMAGLWFGGNRDGVVGFMGELSFVEKRAEGGGETVKLRYLELPALLRLNIGRASPSGFRVYGIAGPVFDIKIGDEGFNIIEEYEGFDVGVLAGGGFEVARIGFELRGNWGLRQINRGALTDLQEIKTFTLQAVAKIRIN